MIQARALNPRVVRIPWGQVAGIPEGPWACRTKSAPAMPLQVVSHRRTAAYDEVIFGAPMTPRAPYVLCQENDAGPSEIAVFDGYASSSLTSRRLDLWALLPGYHRRIDTTGDLRAFIACLQDIVDHVMMRIETMTHAFDLERAGAEALALILADQGNPFTFALDTRDARRLSSVLVDIYRQKGTARGIANAIRLFLGLEVEEMRCHIVTKDDAGIIVGGADPASLYAFDVAVGHPLTDAERQRIRAIAEYLKPAHTHLIDILPQPAGFPSSS